MKGAGSDVVAKFFATWESAVLFPEYVARAVHQGMEENDILPQMIATETRISGLDYRSIASTPTEEEKQLNLVAEGAAIPETRVHTQENLVQLHKRGRMLVASYEAIQFQRLDLFSVTLRQIGAYISRMQVADAIDALQNGDGNENAAPVYTVGTAPIAAGLTFQGTGQLVTPMGATLLRSSAVPSGTILGLDRNYALEMVRASDVLVEYDKLIDRQLERAAVTSIAGFAKIFTPAAKVLQIGTAPAEPEEP